MKRFHETTKWDDPWFAGLPLKAKLVWDYLLSKCDNSGVWTPNLPLAEFQIGAKIDWPDTIAALAKNLRVLENGKWWVPSFIRFQYGKLSDDARVHQSVVKLLQTHGLTEKYNEWLLSADAHGKQSHHDPIAMTCCMSQGQEKGQEQEQGQGGAGGGEAEKQFESVWTLYPKKKGKQEAKPAIIVAIKRHGFQRIFDRVSAYAAAVALWPPDDLQYVPDPVRWFKRGQFDDDPATWRRGSTQPLISEEFRKF